MISALVAGTLMGKPVARTGKNKGTPYVTAMVRCPTKDDALLVQAMAFSDTARAALLALDAGDAVATTGPLTVGVWHPDDGPPRPSVRLVAQQVMTPYAMRHKSQAMLGDNRAATPARQDRRRRPLAQVQRSGGDGFIDEPLEDVLPLS